MSEAVLLGHINETVACHFLWLWQIHNLQDAWSHIGEATGVDDEFGILGDVDDRHGVQRMCGVGSAVSVDGVVGITMVGDDDDFIASGACCLNRVMYTAIHSLYGLADGIIDSRMTSNPK